MSTLAADNPRIYEAGHDDYENELPIIAADIVYDGAAVGELNDSGTFQPLNLGATTVDKFGGFAVEQCDNSSGAAGAKRIKVKQRGRVILSVTGASAITDYDKDVWATDDDTFTLTYAAGAIWIGKVARWMAGTKCVVSFVAFHLRQAIQITHDAETVDLATDRAFFVANRPYYIKSIIEIHSVAAGGASKLQVTKDTGTTAPGAGTDLLSDNTAAGFDLAATANTLQTGTIVTTAGVRKLGTGDRLSRDNADAIQSTAGVKIGVELVPL